MITKQSISILFLLTLFVSIYGYEKDTDLYSFSISNSDVIDSIEFNGKKFKVDMVSEFGITPNRITFKNSKLKDILKVVFVLPEKYIKVDNEQLYDFTLVLKQNSINTDTIRRIFVSNLFESLHFKVNFDVENIVVYDLVVIDSLKFGTLASNQMTKNTCISEIAYQLDNRYNHIFITGNDTSRIDSIDLKDVLNFDKLEEKFKREYGLGFRKINKDIRFIKIE